MSAVIQRLKEDHREFSHLIEHLEKEMNQCLRGEGIELDTVREFVDYCSEHADLFHHPLEDHLFKQLMTRYPESRPLIQDLEKEHLDLRWATRDLEEMIDTVGTTDYVRRDRFLEALGEYLGLFYQHMRREEMEVFPLAERHLESSDWQDPEQWMALAPAAIFGDPHHPRYSRIADILRNARRY